MRAEVCLLKYWRRCEKRARNWAWGFWEGEGAFGNLAGHSMSHRGRVGPRSRLPSLSRVNNRAKAFANRSLLAYIMSVVEMRENQC
jgi:hypothetical protein